jgi:hypothetical protein
LSEEEAFLVASRRIGGSGALEKEFGKVNGNAVWLERVMWMMIGIQSWSAINTAISGVVRNVLIYGWANVSHNWEQNDATLPVVLFAMVQLASLSVSAWFVWWLVSRKGGGFGRWVTNNLQDRFTFLGRCVTICLILICLYGISTIVQLWLMKLLPVPPWGKTGTYLAYSQAIVMPTQLIALVVLTLLVARKRLAIRRA